VSNSCPDCNDTGYIIKDLKTLEQETCPRCGGIGVSLPEYTEPSVKDAIADLAKSMGIKSNKQAKNPFSLNGSLPSEADVWVQTVVAAVRSGDHNVAIRMADKVADAYVERFLDE
jgi:hypothetical protein